MIWSLVKNLTTKFIVPVVLSGGVLLAVSSWNSRGDKIEAQHNNIVQLREELRQQNKTNRQLLKEKERLEKLYEKEVAKKEMVKESLNRWRQKYDELSSRSEEVASWNSTRVPHAVVEQLRDQAREVGGHQDKPGFGTARKVVPPSKRHTDNAAPEGGNTSN